MIDIGLYVGYGLLIFTLGAALLLPALNAIKSPKDLAKSGMGIGAIVVLFLVSYALSGSEVTAKYVSQGIGEGSSKMIGAGLTMFYIVFIIALIGIVYSEINKAIK